MRKNILKSNNVSKIVIKFLFNEERNEKETYIWNMIGSILNAFQSVVLLMIITRTIGLKESGIFTLAYANANLFLTLGKYGVRNFQSTDINHQFTFYEYKNVRIFTSIMMIIIALVHTVFTAHAGNYSCHKILIIILVCILKVFDSIEDVYHGYCQQHNRLDIAAKAMSLRLIVTLLTLVIGLFISKDLPKSLILSIIITMFVCSYFNNCIMNFIDIKEKKCNIENMLLLLKTCFPLCLGSFLSFYIGNAPKYAIDRVLSDEMQACYGFISMPVFVIGLLNGFIFSPILFRISVLWKEGKIKEFVNKILIQCIMVIIITLVCIGGAYIMGIPVLSFLYSTDLTAYKNELLILLLGGGLLCMSGLLNTVLIIIRKQKNSMYGYLLVTAVAVLFADKVVAKHQMMGAAWLYVILMAILCLTFFLMILYAIVKEANIIKEISNRR